MKYYLLNPYLRRVMLAVLADAMCFFVAAAGAWLFNDSEIPIQLFLGLTAAGALLTFIALYYCDAYSPQVLGSGRANVSSLMNAMGLAFIATLFVYFAVHTPAGATENLALMAGIYFPLLLSERITFRMVSALPQFNERVLVVGASELGLAIARAMRERPNLGMQLIGFLTDEEDLVRREFSLEGYPVLGKVHEIEKIMDRHGIGRVVVASKNRDEYFPAEELLAAKLRNTRIESGISFYEHVTGRIYLRGLRASYLIFSDGFRQGFVSSFLKRSLDIAVASIGLALAAPVLVLAAIAIKFDSKGPVIFRQERLGKDAKPYGVMKLRSMQSDAEKNGPAFACQQDARVTRVGRFIRKTRLDEVPQLLNVLRGEMSLVGPRPERPEFVDSLSERYPYFRLRCSIKPGVTGWAQIRHGYVNELSGFEEKLALDLYYMKYRSVKMDLLILWHTAKTLVLFQGV